jgi:hypothetical protein
VTEKQVLLALVKQIEIVANRVLALESAAKSPKYGGRQITQEQLTDLQLQAQAVQSDAFQQLQKAVDSLP